MSSLIYLANIALYPLFFLSITRDQFVCFDLDGHVVWSSGATNRFGLGSFLLADGKFFILNDTGVLTIARAGTTAFEPLGQAKILDGPDAWAPMALAGKRLIARDSRTMVVVDIGARE